MSREATGRAKEPSENENGVGASPERRLPQPQPERVLQQPPFSTAVRCGRTVYVSGQGGIDMQSKAVAGPDLETQMEYTMRNLEEALARAGLALEDVVQATVYLSDRSLYAPFNELYRRYFRPPYPARTVVYCELNYDLLVEIDAIAANDGEKTFY